MFQKRLYDQFEYESFIYHSISLQFPLRKNRKKFSSSKQTNKQKRIYTYPKSAYIGIYLSLGCSTRLCIHKYTHIYTRIRIKQPEANYHDSVEITSVRIIYPRSSSRAVSGNETQTRDPGEARRSFVAKFSRLATTA